MQGIIYSIKGLLSFNNFPLLTILANIFWGCALGKILVTPSDELDGSIFIKALLTIGTCIFASYLMCLRRALNGINRNASGRLRPFLREAILCAFLNIFILLTSIMLFFVKSRFLLVSV
jgi:hypothetical protein